LSFSERVKNRLIELKKLNRFRSLKTPQGLDLCSNDYLGLSKHPELLLSLKEGIDLYGGGSTASRLIRGHRDVFETLETQFSNWVNSNSSLFLSNGFLANLGLINCITDKKTILYSDRLNHASLLDGMKLSGTEVRYYKHLDLNHLEELLKKKDISSEKIVITESIFSMDGDRANIPDLVYLKNKYQFILILDEAHALGIYGKLGSGLSNSYLEKFSDSIDFRIFTAGKSLGLEGAFVSCSSDYKEFLINHMRTFIFSTAPLPAIAHALQKSITLVQSMEEARKELILNSEYLREQLKKLGYTIKNSTTHIIPILLKDDSTTMKAAEYLQSEGFDIRGIRPPTVKEPRLRLIINSNITQKQISNLLEVFKTMSVQPHHLF
jgi:8-amino-7-oxononanoate synthase